MKLFYQIFYFTIISFSLFACTNSDISSEIEYTEYKSLLEKYNFQDVEDAKYLKSAESLEPIRSLEELKAVLAYVSSRYKYNNDRLTYLDLKTKTRPGETEEGGTQIVIVSGNTPDGSVDVHLDITTPAVVTSRFYNTGIWDAFIGYEHTSGETVKSLDKIDFTANGDIILKIIWQGIELKRFPTTSTGYYDELLETGEITNI